MKIEDKFYPTIGITSHGTIREDANGYRWIIETYMAGPDDMKQTESKRFFKKSECTMDMLSQFGSVVENQLRELCK